MSDQTPPRPDWPPTTFFGGLSQAERYTLFRFGRRKEFNHGEHLLRQGGTGRDVFVVISGRVEVKMLGRGSRDQRIAVRLAGDIVGEMACVDAKPRSASVSAVGAVSALNLPSTAFTRFLEGSPAVHRQLVRTLVERLRASDQRQLDVRNDVESRVAATLCQLATTDSDSDIDALIVRKTQRELGEMIGAATVSIHRALRKLAGRDCLRTEHGVIKILDFDGLAEIAGARSTMHRLM